MALGDAASTLRLVLGRSMLLVGLGTACGLAASVAVTRAIAGLPTTSARSSGGVCCRCLATAGFAATLIPAHRATRGSDVAPAP